MAQKTLTVSVSGPKITATVTADTGLGYDASQATATCTTISPTPEVDAPLSSSHLTAPQSTFIFDTSHMPPTPPTGNGTYVVKALCTNTPFFQTVMVGQGPNKFTITHDETSKQVFPPDIEQIVE